MEKLSAEYADLWMNENVMVEGKADYATVMFITRDSSAVGHSGYFYASNDIGLKAISLHRGWFSYKQVALHWYHFSM